MKLLCVCEQGQVRSVALAGILKKRKFDVLACGVNANSKETLDMLIAWADTVIALSKKVQDKLPKDEKVVLLDIGYDNWGNPTDPELIKTLERKVYEVSYRLFKK